MLGRRFFIILHSEVNSVQAASRNSVICNMTFVGVSQRVTRTVGEFHTEPGEW